MPPILFFTFSRRDCLDAPYVCMRCKKRYQSEDSSKDHKRTKSDCQNAPVGMLQFRRRLLVSTISTEHMVESRKGFIPLDARLQPIQPVNVDGVEGADHFKNC